MKLTSVMLMAVAGLVAILVSQADGRSAVVERVSSALQESFTSLDSKRRDWFENYSVMDNLTKAANTQLKELGMASEMVLPLLWYMYRNTVTTQKNNYLKLVDVGMQSLPYHFETSLTKSPLGLNYYWEATFILQNYRDFQVQIFKDEGALFFLNLDFDESRAVMGYDHDQQRVEKVVLDGDRFPAIHLNQPFRINVQVMSDCIVASFWLTNLDLTTPMPLPEKHIWCSRDYSYGQKVSFDINTLNEEDEHHQHHDSQEEEEQASHEDEQASQETSQEEEASEIQIASTVIYNGFIYQ